MIVPRVQSARIGTCISRSALQGSELRCRAAQGVAKLVGLLAIALGGAFTFGGQQTLGDSLTPFPVPRDGAELVTDGAYSYTRHPMYTGVSRIERCSGLQEPTNPCCRF